VRPLLAVDGDSLAHRAYHGLPSSMTDGDGHPANMIVGFTNMLLSVWESERPRTVFVGFDFIGRPTYRNELLPVYQAGRDFPPDLTYQLDRLPELVSALGFPWAKQPGFEADDFLAAAASSEEKRGGATLVLTSDRDLFQLASERTTLLMPRRGVRELDRVGPAEVHERYGVSPSQVPDFIALRGDPSDRIPGARGIGAKRAAVLLKQFETLDAALESGEFPTQADDLRTYLRIARLQYHAPLPELPDAEARPAQAGELVRGWGLEGLVGRLRERGA
jgi:DNA polymerase I